MLRKFINQENLSNKFWNIESNGCTQTVTYGKIGTKGRTSTKTFDTSEACQEATEKLISQKLKKGYVEIENEEEIPEKEELSEDEKADIFFWNIIEGYLKRVNTQTDGYDIDEHIEKIESDLSKYGKERQFLFEKKLREYLLKLDTIEIVELYFILNYSDTLKSRSIDFEPYIGDDDYLYFRCWLILHGEDTVSNLLEDLDSIIKKDIRFNLFDLEEMTSENLLYVSDGAYQIRYDEDEECYITGEVYEAFPELCYDTHGGEYTREQTPAHQLIDKYPSIFEHIDKLKEC